ncbi:MAG: DUF1176 domain-containing protein [Acidobacteria bacterium]|nr:DUF1176 domain-containing protein [Acidobacteriota bacterium]
MEAYSVLKAIEHSNQKICGIIVKGVCDFADDKKNDSAHLIAATAAAETVRDLARDLVPKLRSTSPAVESRVEYLVKLPRPALSYRDRVAWQCLLDWEDEDSWRFLPDDNEPTSEGKSGIEFYEVGENKWLVEVELGFAAYNGSFCYYYFEENGAPKSITRVEFRTLNWDHRGEIYESVETAISGNAWFDSESSRICTFYKGRGIGDCGQFVTYAFDEGRTDLVEFRHREIPDSLDAVDEVPALDEWPEIDVSKRYPRR